MGPGQRGLPDRPRLPRDRLAVQDGTSAGRYIERRKGDGGYMVILQVPMPWRSASGSPRSACARSRRRTCPSTSTRTSIRPTRRASCCRSTRPLRRRRRSRAVVAAGREGLAAACALERHRGPGRRRDPGRGSGRGRRPLVEDSEPAGRGRHHPARRRWRDPLRADRRRPWAWRLGLRREGGRPRPRPGRRQEARQAAGPRLRSKSAAAGSTWCRRPPAVTVNRNSTMRSSAG